MRILCCKVNPNDGGESKEDYNHPSFNEYTLRQLGAIQKLFNYKYFSLSLSLAKEMEFMDLKQTRDMNVAQYEDAFTRLIKYMPNV